MRLTTEECRQIAASIDPLLKGSGALYLYGSRTDDQKKGGDIDLLLLVNGEEKEALLSDKHLILLEIKERIGDQRVDLTIATEKECASDPFLQSIQTDLELLRRW